MSTFFCDIVTPESLIFSEEVNFVSIPAAEGEFGVFAKRSPIMSTLNNGEIRVKREEGGESLRFAVSGGYVESDGSKVVVLASRAVDVSKVDLDEMRAARDASEKKLAALAEEDSRAVFYRDELAWYTLLEKLISRT
ncbi:MAG: ATP synthase F1 subunit epsilon [Coriobacteriales bacterium]|jgi:F-type H+-transporting ATPase subunit epsilon|nr:ATP synthase F1 subunit epsilon [Coriobacteriales bacterium]